MMKIIPLVIAICGVVGAAQAQKNAFPNPYAEKSEYMAHRAYDTLTHSDHMLRCKILYKEVKHTSAYLYSNHIFYTEVVSCYKGSMIGKGCVISYSKQMEDRHETPEGRHEAEGEVFLGFDSHEVEFDPEKKMWKIRGDFAFRPYVMGSGYNPGEAMQRVIKEHPELLDCPDPVLTVEHKLTPFIAELSKINTKSMSAYDRLCIQRLLSLLPLIKEGQTADVVLPESKGNTALHYACALGNVELVKCLLELGANPNALTDKGATPLRCAGGKDALKIQALLKEYGATR